MTDKKVRIRVLIILIVALAVAILVPAPSGTSADVPSPTVEGPIPYSVGTHGFPYTTVPNLAELTAMGYTEQEFFFSGTVPSASGPQPYKSRMIVRLPIDPQWFNGTVVAEWLNVTTGSDVNLDWALLRRQIVRGGYAYVGVSAQYVGICKLKTWDPVRYGELTHPALLPGPCPTAVDLIEPYSNDIFSQAGKAIRENPLILNGLVVRQLLATGASQSALRLVNYINAYSATTQLYDGFLVHVIGMGGGRLITGVNPKVLILNSENEVLGYYPFRGRQPANVRYWEVAGVAHNAELPYHKAQTEHTGGTWVFPCDYPDPDAFIPSYPVGNAALDALNRWVAGGAAPLDSPLVEVIPGTPNQISRDQYGNPIGGIRLPQLEAPTGRYIGSNSPTGFCRFSGGFDLFDGQPAGTTPNDMWNEPTLDQLYPNHVSYVSAFSQAVNNIVGAGFMLEPDAEIAKAEAAGSGISACFRSPQYYWLNLERIRARVGGRDAAVIIGGVNFNQPISVADNLGLVRSVLQGGLFPGLPSSTPLARLNQQFLAAQLSLALAGGTGSPKVYSVLNGQLQYYGGMVSFRPVNLTNGIMFTPFSTLGELFEQALFAIRENRTADMAALASLFDLLNGNNPSGNCHP